MNVGEMQRKLSLWAEQDSDRRFYGLFDLVCNPDWLRAAHDHVASNAGSSTAGCDGITMQVFDEQLEEHLQQIARALAEGHFEPHPVRRVTIPKARGGVRPLGIPSIRDRIVQEALRMVLEPIYEATFRQDSFGFRPGRCTMDAVHRLRGVAQNHTKYFWAIEGDIAACFDTINHRKLIKLLRRRVKDEKLLDLIWKFLRAGVMEGKLFRDTKLGTPQGGIVSPLLANVYLHELDRFVEEHYTGFSAGQRSRRRAAGQANFIYARYADDFVLMCNGTHAQAADMKEVLGDFLREALRLKLSREKTKVTHVNDGFDFLGYRIVRKRGSSGKKVAVTLIPPQALRRVRDTLFAATAPGTERDSVATKIVALNRIVRGWCNYYRYASRTSRSFSQLEHVLFWRFAHWLGRKYRIQMPVVMRRFVRRGFFEADTHQLLRPTSIKTARYRKSLHKPNPYTMQEQPLDREDAFELPKWLGQESRPGMADLKRLALVRAGYQCQACGRAVTDRSSQADHIRRVKRFVNPRHAHTLDNVQTLCIPCHADKTKSERQMESRVH